MSAVDDSFAPDFNTVEDFIWEDRKIDFDLPFAKLKCRAGEFEIDSIDTIEDTKGNNGERGSLSVTNLRLIWISLKNPKVNLSIGWNCVVTLRVHTAQSRLRGATQALFVLTKFNGSRFEFIFTNLIKNSPRLFSTAQAVHRAYETSKPYRELKLRAAIVKEKELILLPQEEITTRIKGVWNLSSDQGNLGTLLITNVRIVWFADLAENFNVSIPYLQIKSVRVRESKFGAAFVIETSPQSGSYVLGFRVDPIEKMKKLFKEVSSLHRLYSKNPIFGVEFAVEEKTPSLDQLRLKRPNEDVQIVGDEDVDPLAAYYTDGGIKNAERDVLFNTDLGLAIEQPKDGAMGVDKLWEIHFPKISLTS